ncbi:hypothetical protein FOA52_007012 [Chlamydomonas sp. UWO 241]|nr:hypothetical protein FOA52_007012 [Chlamydomonas sp. UWO 241]
MADVDMADGAGAVLGLDALLHQVLRHLSTPASFANACLTCKRWADALREDHTWGDAYNSTFGEPDAEEALGSYRAQFRRGHRVRRTGARAAATAGAHVPGTPAPAPPHPPPLARLGDAQGPGRRRVTGVAFDAATGQLVACSLPVVSAPAGGEHAAAWQVHTLRVAAPAAAAALQHGSGSAAGMPGRRTAATKTSTKTSIETNDSEWRGLASDALPHGVVPGWSEDAVAASGGVALVICPRDASAVQVLDLRSRAPRGQLHTRLPGGVVALATARGWLGASVCEGGALQLWDLRSLAQIGNVVALGGPAPGKAAGVSGWQPRLAAALDPAIGAPPNVALVAAIGFTPLAGPEVSLLRAVPASEGGGPARYERLQSLSAFNPTSLCFGRGRLHIAGGCVKRCHASSSSSFVSVVAVADVTAWPRAHTISMELDRSAGLPVERFTRPLADAPRIHATEATVLLAWPKMMPVPPAVGDLQEEKQRIEWTRRVWVKAAALPTGAREAAAQAAQLEALGSYKWEESLGVPLTWLVQDGDKDYGEEVRTMVSTPSALVCLSTAGELGRVPLMGAGS